MLIIGKYDKLFFPQTLYYVDYLYVYADNDNNIGILIQTTPEITDTTESEILDEYVVYTMLDDML